MKSRFAVSTCMHERVSDTLGHLAALASPVVRSCHIGNNTSNIWGWLALTPNSKLVQYDHTRYGLDENCFPWVVLGDHGRVSACYDHTGESRPEWVGRHINEHLAAIDRRHCGHLNYGIHADHDGEDLLLYHGRTVAALSARMNGSAPSFDSAELQTIGGLVRQLIAAFLERRVLHLAFDRWIRRTQKKSKYVVAHRIRHFAYPSAGSCEIFDDNSNRVFSGGADDIWNCFMEATGQIARRLTVGTPVALVGYPWFTLELSYLIQSVKEYHADRSQRRFWHAGGSSSQYYINRPSVRSMFDGICAVLGGAGLLPEAATLTMIPTYSCQLFATSDQAMPLIEEIIRDWRSYLDANRPGLCRRFLSLRRGTRPFEIASRAYRQIDPAFLRTLDRHVQVFNGMDANQLPVAHAAYIRHPTYNKFGVAQRNLLRARPKIPRGFYDMRWEEAELLVKIIAHLYVDRPE